MMLTHCGNNVRNRYSGCVFSVKDIVPVPLKTSRNPNARLSIRLLSSRHLSPLRQNPELLSRNQVIQLNDSLKNSTPRAGLYLFSVSEAAPVLCRGGAQYTATIRNCHHPISGSTGT